MNKIIFILLLLPVVVLSTSAQYHLDKNSAPLIPPGIVLQPQSVVRGELQSPKSVTLAIFLSLLIPGIGELYADNASTARYFFIAEGSIWLTYTGFQLHGTWLRRDARSFATLHSGAVYSGKDDKFAVDVGNYESAEAYNEAKLRARQNDLLYVSADYSWRWDSEQHRNGYRGMRIRSDEAYRNANFAVAALVVNRLASAFFAGRSAAAFNSSLEPATVWKLEAVPQGGYAGTHGMELRITRSF